MGVGIPGDPVMFTLRNTALAVEILDPLEDSVRLGTRYCSGGYIFQVTDQRHGPLLSGPTFPDSFNTFDGQGIPDAFKLGPLHSTQTLGHALIIGTGVVDLQADALREPCAWVVSRSATALEFVAQQRYEAFEFTLSRTVSLCGRSIRSHTCLANTGRSAVPIRWFPHPFFPQGESDELLWINCPLQWQNGAGYRQLENGFIARADWPWHEGHYLPLNHAATSPLVAMQRHPLTGLVSAACSYVPDFFPIWGNPATFSWEPFFERTVATGQQTSWWIDYVF
jgi:hypothetical protein